MAVSTGLSSALLVYPGQRWIIPVTATLAAVGIYQIPSSGSPETISNPFLEPLLTGNLPGDRNLLHGNFTWSHDKEGNFIVNAGRQPGDTAPGLSAGQAPEIAHESTFGEAEPPMRSDNPPQADLGANGELASPVGAQGPALMGLAPVQDVNPNAPMDKDELRSYISQLVAEEVRKLAQG